MFGGLVRVNAFYNLYFRDILCYYVIICHGGSSRSPRHVILHPMKKPLREKGNEKENKVKEKEKGLLSKNLYTIQESEKHYCTAKE